MKIRIVLGVAALALIVGAVFQLVSTKDIGSASPELTAQSDPVASTASQQEPVPPPTPPVAAASTSNAVSRQAVLNPYAGALQSPGKSKRSWDMDFMRLHQRAAAGEAIEFELTDGKIAKGVVGITQYRDGELTYISGNLSEPESGEFFFLTPPELGVAGRAVGVVMFPSSETAYRIEPTGPGGDPELWERHLDEVICRRMPEPEGAMSSAGDTNQTMEIPPLRPDESAMYVPSYNSNIVSLQSYPGATGVLLLDFAGGYTPTWGGVYYAKPSGIDNNTIRDVWKRVAEDYMPFNINVTTDFKVYSEAPETSRQRVAFTDTPVTAAGVAFYGSWNWGGDTPCWSKYTTGKSAGEVASHEAGHTLQLSHQGQWDGVTTTNEYFGGHGSGETGWAPIMGVGYYQPIAQWAKGEYSAANQQEDELSRIVSNNNSVDYRTDDTGGTLATSRYLEVYLDGSVSAEGVIERTGDPDAFRFTTTGGTVYLAARPVHNDWANLAVSVSIANSGNVVIQNSNPQSTIWASIKTTLAAGTYTFRVTGVGRNDPLYTGFTSYGSLGYYSIVGYIPGATPADRFDLAEHVPNGTTVGTVEANSTGNLSYSIISGNTGGTFTIDNSGVLTVANNTLLDYDQRSTASDIFVGFEMFVTILNQDNPSLNELNRRVVVTLQSEERAYPVSVSGFNASLVLPYNATTTVPQTTAFDVPNNYAFYQEGLNGNAQINASDNGLQGLPNDRRISSQVDGSTFELETYGTPNALMLGNNYPSSGVLTLENPQPFNKLAVLATSANGGGLGRMVLNFANGTHSQAFDLNAQDWYNVTANVATEGFGRVRLGQGTFSTENPGWDNPNIYQTTIDLATLGLNEVVSSISFTGPSVGGNRTTAILGVSGQVMPSSVAIAVQPVSVTNNVPSASAAFSVKAMGTPDLGYQWFHGNPGTGVMLAGQTSPNLVLTSIQPADAGNYYVVVTNSFSSATSEVAALTVFRAPQIVQQPAPVSSQRAIGESLSYSVVANAALPVSYHWRTNGVQIPWATAATLNLLNLQSNNAASYSVLVSNAFGSVLSTSAQLTIVPPDYPYAQLVLAADPVSYFRLDETGGSTAFDSVGGRNGTYLNTLLGQPGYNLVGTHKSARFGYLSSQNSYVAGIPIDFGSEANQSLTVEAWIKGTVPSTDAGLITKGTGAGGEQFNLDCGGGGHAYRFFVRKDDGGAVLASGSIKPNNQWQHVVGVLNRSAGYVALYVNGVQNAINNDFPTENYHGLLRTDNAMTIGSRQSGSGSYDSQFSGYMQDVAIYNRALTPAQILSHYQAASNRAPVFVSNPITQPTANAGQSYAAAINTEASDPNGDAVIFAKVDGPSWLAISDTGYLSGIPANTNANTNTFIVSARDPAGLTSTATLNIYVNASPVFDVDPFSLPDQLVGQLLSLSIATNVTDLNPGETLNYAKIEGPDWIQIATDGTVNGTPAIGDVGTNTVTVSVTDSGDLTDTATMLVRVLSAQPLLQVTLVRQGEDLLLSWSGGTPPYQVEMNTNLSESTWQQLGAPTPSTSLLITPSNAETFYRVNGN